MPRSALLRVIVIALLAATVFGCAKHTGTLAPTLKDPYVFQDTFGSAVDFQAFSGSKFDAIAIDTLEKFSGTASLRVTIPNVGDASGSYAGGAFTTARARDLSGYNAISFWAKASRTMTLDIAGLGNDNTGNSKYTASSSSLPVTTSWKKFVIPIPLPEKLAAEKGLFFFAEGPELGVGGTLWFDEIMFVNDTTISNPRPLISTVTLTPDVGTTVTVPGTQVTYSVNGVNQVDAAMQGYFTFTSSADSIAHCDGSTIHVVGLGDATISAKLGVVPAAGAITLHTNAPPATAAPTPTVPAANVISLFSNSYSNVIVDTWSASWDMADVTDLQISGNDVKKYSNLTYAGIEFTSHKIDATSMTALHLDFWAPHGSQVKVKLVDFGANAAYGGGDDSQSELTFNAGTTPSFASGSWQSMEIPMSAFAGLTARAHLAQLLISGDAASGMTTLYVDNIYFHN